MGRFPLDFKLVVAAELAKTTGFIWAFQEPGLSACRFEVTVPGRRFVDISALDLERLQLPRRWLVGFLIVQEVDLVTPLAWASRIDAEERRRIVFLIGPGADERRCQDAIAEAAPGCRFDSTPGLGSVDQAHMAHARFGEYHSRQAYDDRGL